MAYIEESLSSNEQVVEIFRLHGFAYLPVVGWAILAIPTFGITLPIAIYVYLKLKFTEQGVTSKRIILKTGIISRISEEMKISSVETVEIKQGVLGRLFGFGNLEITGRGSSDLVFRNIDNPMAVKRSIESVNAVE